jgi:hemerythrin-like domain-containing protein
MKRDKNLLVFSHEHHHGLIFCSRLQKVNNVDSTILLHYINDFWDNYLDAHFTNEEKLFLPFLNDEKLALQFLDEHRIIKALISDIKNHQTELKTKALKLSRLIHDHIRFEERAFFPWLEEIIQPFELEKIGKALEEIEITEHTFKPSFWLEN